MSYQCPLQVTGYVVDEAASVWTVNGMSVLLLSMPRCSTCTEIAQAFSNSQTPAHMVLHDTPRSRANG